MRCICHLLPTISGRNVLLCEFSLPSSYFVFILLFQRPRRASICCGTSTAWISQPTPRMAIQWIYIGSFCLPMHILISHECIFLCWFHSFLMVLFLFTVFRSFLAFKYQTHSLSRLSSITSSTLIYPPGSLFCLIALNTLYPVLSCRIFNALCSVMLVEQLGLLLD